MCFSTGEAGMLRIAVQESLRPGIIAPDAIETNEQDAQNVN